MALQFLVIIVFICICLNSNLFKTISCIHLDPCASPSPYCHWAYACVYGSQLHVGLLSPSHTSGAGSRTEHPEGLNFP